ncbi:MAG: gliding motility lipoprotein GldB [Bacteroides sp.]
MKRQNSFLFFLLCMLFVSCRMGTGKNARTQKEESISVLRYDKLLNEYVRSNSFSALQKMNMEYRLPTKILIEEVLSIGEVGDDTISQKLKTFYSDTTLLRLMEDVEERFPNLDKLEKGLTKGFQKLKKEVPEIQIPMIYSQVSALNESIVLTDTLLGISLDKYMGEDYPLYKRFFYNYQCHTMRPDRILPDCFVVYLMGQYPFPFEEGVSLIDVMLHYGKIYYVTHKVLDGHSVCEVLGYSKKEKKWCKDNEERIWEYMLSKGHLYARDPMLMRQYMKPAPVTDFFGEGAPSLIGTWMGSRIVAQYMKRHPQTSLKQLLEMTDYKTMLNESKYLD